MRSYIKETKTRSLEKSFRPKECNQNWSLHILIICIFLLVCISCVDWSLTGLITRTLTVNYSAIVNAMPQQQMHTSLIILYIYNMDTKEETLIRNISHKVILCITQGVHWLPAGSPPTFISASYFSPLPKHTKRCYFLFANKPVRFAVHVQLSKWLIRALNWMANSKVSARPRPINTNIYINIRDRECIKIIVNRSKQVNGQS